MKVKVKLKSLSRVRLFATPWTAACQAPLSMGFSRQEYWSGVPFPSPGLAVILIAIPPVKLGLLSILVLADQIWVLFFFSLKGVSNIYLFLLAC